MPRMLAAARTLFRPMLLTPPVIALTLGLLGGPALAGAPADAPPAPPAETISQLSEAIWAAAKSGDGELAVAEPIRSARLIGENESFNSLRASLKQLEAHFAKRETDRQERMTKVEAEFKEALAGEPTPSGFSKALKSAVELYLLAPDKVAFIQQQRIKDLIQRADRAARGCERAGQWLLANELFIRLNLLLEEDGSYKPDARRVINRLGQIRLYAPQRFWEMRNQRRIDDGQKALPPYNSLGDDFNAKLRGVDARTVTQALVRAAEGHVERKTLRDLLLGGIDSVRTLVTTSDLKAAFPGLDNAEAVARFNGWLDDRATQLRLMRAEPDLFQLDGFITELLSASRQTVRIPDEAVLHELGNGAFDHLDEFSSIIWPDELARFRRIMDGEFIGIGVQIQIDEESQMIKVVSPLEGTPAFRAGIKAGDLIKKIDDASAVGMGIDQAVDRITGARGSKVKLTMERASQDVDFVLARDKIPLKTVKGWKRTGPRDEDWDWFIDPRSKIGYVRLTNFQEDTTSDLTAALDQMKRRGMQGLILDLRFNPGGLLDQAVSVANAFVESGTVVYTEAAGGVRTETRKAVSSGLRVRDLPIVTLINESSASASEIVAGAMRHYSDEGRLRAILIGQRSFGKGSVQNVINLSTRSMMKLTMQYYFLPNGTCIHRREHAAKWGVEPHRPVEMLPQQINDALTRRQDADSPQWWMDQGAGGQAKAAPDPDSLLTDGLDLQLEYALFVLQSQAAARQAAAAIK